MRLKLAILISISLGYPPPSEAGWNNIATAGDFTLSEYESGADPFEPAPTHRFCQIQSDTKPIMKVDFRKQELRFSVPDKLTDIACGEARWYSARKTFTLKLKLDNGQVQELERSIRGDCSVDSYHPQEIVLKAGEIPRIFRQLFELNRTLLVRWEYSGLATKTYDQHKFNAIETLAGRDPSQHKETFPYDTSQLGLLREIEGSTCR